MTVLQVERHYSGEEPGATLTVLLEPQLRHSTYVPCAKATTISGAIVTLVANTYTAVGADVDHFEEGDIVWIYEIWGDVSSRVQREIANITGNVVTMTASVGFAAGSHTIMTGSDYDQVTSNQQKHVHLGDGSTPPVLSTGDTEAFRYV